MYSQYMYILLYVKPIWCNEYCIDLLSIGVHEGDRCILSILSICVCAFCYMCITDLV